MSLLYSIILGGIAGWLAGQIMKGSGYGVVGNVVIGMIGGVIGGFLLRILSFALFGLFGQLIAAVLGSIVLIYVVKQIQA